MFIQKSDSLWYVWDIRNTFERMLSKSHDRKNLQVLTLLKNCMKESRPYSQNPLYPDPDSTDKQIVDHHYRFYNSKRSQ